MSKLLGSIQQIITAILPNPNPNPNPKFFNQKWFFLGVLKIVFRLNDFFQLQLLKKELHIYKARHTNFLKNSNLRSILVMCRKV